jgi:predicted nucleotidyltransferase
LGNGCLPEGCPNSRPAATSYPAAARAVERQRTQYVRDVDQAVAHVDRSPSVPPEMIARIVEVLHPEQVWLFGSRARGEARVDSDWDFMAILADDGPEQDFDLASVWQRLRDLRLRRVEAFTMTRGELANGSARLSFPHRSVGTR